MKKLLLLAVFGLLPLFSQAQINQQCPQFTVNGTPLYPAKLGDQEVCHLNYAVIHKCEVKAPIAVFEHLTKDKIVGGFKRRDDFRPDPKVSHACQAQLSDFAGQPYDRGHMSPAGNNTQSAEIMSESFFLSNMVAQVPNNNRGIWKQLETWEREWAMAGGDFYIISGPIFMPNHKVIGRGVGVPDGLYKIIIEKNSGRVMAYLVEEVFKIILRLKSEGVTMLLVEQFAAAALNVADYAYVLENGSISVHGAADKLKNDPAVQAAYLGTGSHH